MTVEWSGTTASTHYWNQLSSITDSEDGVDFVLRVNDQHPLRVWDDARALRVIDTPLETP